MAARKRLSFTVLGVLACTVVYGGLASEQVWGQEVLPTMRKTPRATTVWVGDDGPPVGPVAVPMRTVAALQKAVPVPQNSVGRHLALPAKVPSVANVQEGVIPVRYEQPVVQDRRAATLQALADGFRSPRIDASSTAEVTEAPITVPSPSIPVVYSAPISKEPVPQSMPVPEFPSQVATPTRSTTGAAVEANMPAMPLREESISRQMPHAEFSAPVATPARLTNTAAVEANMPATLEMQTPISPELSSQSQTRFVTAEDSRQRPETWQTRMITNPLRRAADTLSGRGNPLRTAD